MSRKAALALCYRVWNQLRLAKHVDSYFQVYDELSDATVKEDYGNVLMHARKALYQTIIVHLDMINGRKGVSLRKLVLEAKKTRQISEAEASALLKSIDANAKVFENIRMQRNNLVAHRSETRSFKEIMDDFPVSHAELSIVVETYYSVALRMHILVPFNRPWEKTDERTPTKAMILALQ